MKYVLALLLTLCVLPSCATVHAVRYSYGEGSFFAKPVDSSADQDDASRVARAVFGAPLILGSVGWEHADPVSAITRIASARPRPNDFVGRFMTTVPRIFDSFTQVFECVHYWPAPSSGRQGSGHLTLATQSARWSNYRIATMMTVVIEAKIPVVPLTRATRSTPTSSGSC